MKSLFILCLSLFVCINLSAQKEESSVAQIGNDKISAKEFKLRLELSPYIPQDKNIDPDSLKFDFLYSLIAEKLWAKEAEKFGIANTENFNFYFRPLEEMFIRDALFKIEVEDKALLSANDINNGIIKSQTKLNTQIVTSNDSVSIYDFYNQIISDINFDSLISINKNITSKIFNITLGNLKDEEIEDSLYTLPINGFTSPIKSEVGWVIMIVKDKLFTPIDLGNQQAVDNMKKIIRNRRIEKRYEEFLNELLGGITVNINPESFSLISTIISRVLRNKSNSNDNTNYYELTDNDFNRIKTLLGIVNLNKILFELSDRQVNIENYLSSLAFKGFHVTQLDSEVVEQKLNKSVKQFVEEQLITEEAYKRGLQLTLQVRNDLELWRQNYLAQSFYNSIFDSILISDTEVYNYYLETLFNASNIRLINIRMVSLKDLDEVSNIFESLKQGKDFAELVKNYGETDTLVKDDGETGLRPVILLGYVGSVASDLNLNEVYGPIKRKNGYTILQVIERQDSNDSLKLSFDSIKEQLRNDLRFKKLNEKLIKVTSGLAEKYNVKIFNLEVDKIKSSNIPFFVHRLMGFGGRIAGVPLTTPFSGWLNSEIKQKLLP
ncbi:MAG: peptidylprolyl isomerase [Ignavibacteriota bacterium]